MSEFCLKQKMSKHLKQNRIHWKPIVPVSLGWLLLGCAIGLSGPLGAAEGGRVFRAGAYAMDITPTNFPVICNGGFFAATASQANDRLHARCHYA